jgi:rod shape-determining protein MreD
MLDAQFNEIRQWGTLCISLCLALILMLLPMPSWIAALRPAWVLLVLIFWSLVLPGRISITLAWVMGIVMDVLNGTLLGEHALALTTVIYVAARLNNQLRMFSLFQQGMAVLCLVLLYLFILFCIQGFLGTLPEGWFYWLPALTSMVLWPWVFVMLRDQYRSFEN